MIYITLYAQEEPGTHGTYSFKNLKLCDVNPFQTSFLQLVSFTLKRSL